MAKRTEDPDTSTPKHSANEKTVVPLIMQPPVIKVRDAGELFDDLIGTLGGYGLYQKRLTFLVILPLFFFVAFINCVMTYNASEPRDNFCAIPELIPGHQISPDLLDVTISADDRYDMMPFDNTSTNNRSSCTKWAVDYTKLFRENKFSVDLVVNFLNGSHNFSQTNCVDGWEYLHPGQWESSVITEFSLVCEWSNGATISAVFQVIGFVLGIIVGGFCADKWGRKPVFFVALFIFITFGLSSAFAPTFPGFVALATIHSFGSGPLYYVLYTLGVENLTLKHRVTFVVWLSVIFAFGSMAFILVAYFVMQWRTLTIIGTAPFYLLFIYVFFIPESPRWYLVHERFAEIEQYFRHIARVNGIVFDENCQKKLKAIYLQCDREVTIESSSKMSRWERVAWTRLFKTPPMRRKTLLLIYLMCTLQICYAGLRRFAPSFTGLTGIGSDEYFDTFINFLVEIPGYILTALLCDRLGRRVTLMLLFAAAFISCLCTLAFPSDPKYFWGIIAVFLLAKIFYAGAYIVGELLVYETFPTVIRLQGVALIESIAFIISHLGSLIVRLQFHSLILPLIIFGCLGLVAVLCVFILPETVSSALPETVEEADMRGAFFRAAANLRVPELRKKLKYSVAYKKNSDKVKEDVEQRSDKRAPEVITRPAQQIPPRSSDV